MSPKVTQEPPSRVGGGIESAVAVEARLAPVMVMNDPGLMLVVVPSFEFTTPRVALIVGSVALPVGVRATTLNPDSVMAYAVVCAAFTTSWRGVVLNRAAPSTV